MSHVMITPGTGTIATVELRWCTRAGHSLWNWVKARGRARPSLSCGRPAGLVAEASEQLMSVLW